MTEENSRIPIWEEQLAQMKDIETEAHERGMKHINIWQDHVLIELECKTLKVWYDGKVEELK